MIDPDNRPLLDLLMNHAVDLAEENVAAGGIPFAALVVDGAGKIVGQGVNTVAKTIDPTAHAEIVAIRDACSHIRSPRLAGYALIASGEPCAMCALTAMWCGIGQVFFAVDRDGAARCGFDYRNGYRLLAHDPLNPAISLTPHAVDGSWRPFEHWLRRFANAGC